MQHREGPNGFMHRFKPGVPKRYLLLIAGLVWTFASFMLGGRGLAWLDANDQLFMLHLAIDVVLGLGFFILVFAKVSFKHISRIQALELAKPSLFAFFDTKGYIMMGIMITAGILLRSSGLVPPEILYNFYVLMGTPLLVSAFRFYYAFAVYPKLLALDGPGGGTGEGLGQAD